ncbi:class I SAM-dependent methyltransferase [Paenibacillus chitinolyticus]|uniref:class I SAM-dependent methyltransferase n=1 Tax=Paenibacillus chitinolyticus TaxID=79263 RepID=UPI002DB9B427|nr:class I SAM-dependent methyltransferase [Paenibacillus chitinolyticus]MEC0247176.1 class I SAM-dependent methyltransferase [Paenibacillus chitinolyticus]
MADHYYTQKPTVKHDVREIEFQVGERKLRLMTDAGVFSKNEVDFGSRLLIETMALLAKARVLDVGCGYGPIGLSAAFRYPAAHVTMVDINERAVELSRQNAERNGIRNVTVLQSDKLEAVKTEKFDVVLTNPPIRAGKQTVHAILEEACECLNPGGALWVVIQKKQGSPSAFAKMEELFGEAEEVTKDKGYRILRAFKK